MSEIEQVEKAIAALEAQRAILGDELVDTALLPLQDKLAALRARHAGERKQVTVLFASVVGLPGVISSDVEEMNRMMSAVWARLDAAVRAQGGIVDKHTGNRMMALFGATVAHENDPQRAIRAALAMQADVEAFSLPAQGTGAVPAGQLSLKLGINTGPVLLGAIGSRAEYTAVGDAVNVASRVEETAQPGELLVSHATYRHVRGVFTAFVREPAEVRGRRTPVRTYLITGEKPRAFHVTPLPVAGQETLTVGREQELALLQATLRQVMAGDGAQVVAISGEAGVGKSRLLYEFQNWLELMEEVVWLFKGEAEAQTRALPYALIHDLLTFRFEIRASDPAPIARQKLQTGICAFLGEGNAEKAHFIGQLSGFDFTDSPYLQGILDDAPQIQARAFHYFGQFLEAMSAQRPVVIFLECMHWADQGSLRLLRHVLHERPEMALLLLVLARPPFFSDKDGWALLAGRGTEHTLELAPLSPADSRRLLRHILRGARAIPLSLEQMVVERAAGNPFYLEELVKMLIDDGVIVPQDEQWEVRLERLVPDRVPDTLRGVLQARLDALTAAEREVLQRAAVVGQQFWEEAVSSIRQLGDGAAETEALQTLAEKELVFRRATSTFAGTAAYTFKHAILHNVAYESVLLRRRRAYHASVARWLIKRADQRAGEHAALIAYHFEQAENAREAATWYRHAGRRAEEAYLPETAIRHYHKALSYLEQVGRPAQERVLAYQGLGNMLWRQARRDETAVAYEAMREAAEEAGSLLDQTRAWNLLARVQRYRGDYRLALNSAREAEALAQRTGADARSERARALALQGWCYHGLGDAERALQLGQQALALSQELGAQREQALNLNLLGVASDALGRFQDGTAYKEQALEVYRQMGNRWGVGITYNNLGENARFRGHFRAALAYYDQALHIARELGNRESEITCLNNIGAALVGVRSYKEAEATLRQAIVMVGRGGWFALSESYRFLAEACLGQVRPGAALEMAQEALRLGQEKERPDFIGAAWRTLGQIAARGHAVSIAGVVYSAEDCFGTAADVFAEAALLAERAHTLYAWGEYERSQGQQVAGARKCRQARQLLQNLGVTLEVATMER